MDLRQVLEEASPTHVALAVALAVALPILLWTFSGYVEHGMDFFAEQPGLTNSIPALSRPSVPSIEVELTETEEADELKGPAHPEMKIQVGGERLLVISVLVLSMRQKVAADPKHPGVIRCFEPGTLQLLGEVEAMTPERVEEVVLKAKKAQEAWVNTTFAERRRVLMTMQKYITGHVHEICRVASRDSGKPLLDALLGEVLTTCEKIRCVCANGEKWLQREVRPNGPLMMHKTSYVEYHPLGVLGVIAPWNYPFHNVMNHVVSGIFAGNAVVSKVSEYTSWSSAYFSRIVQASLRACGHDPDLVQVSPPCCCQPRSGARALARANRCRSNRECQQVVTGFGEAGAALVACKNIDKIIFTGSPGVGRMVMKGAAPHLKPVILELGGKDPLVICEDAKLGEVVPMAMRGCFQNAGQNCCGIERILCYEGIQEEFVATVKPMIEKLRQGPALGHGLFDVGAMVMPRQIEIIQELVDDAVAKGAKLLVGGRQNKDWDGNFYLPTLLTGVNKTMRIANEEVFGPVMAVMTVPNNDDELAVEIINDCDFGLGSAVFSNDQKRATRIGNRIRAGMTTVNDFGVNYLVQSLPFGGIKESGFDRFAGPEGLRACCLMKSVVVDTFSFIRTSIPGPLQYPIAEVGLDFGKSMVGLMYNEGILGKASALIQMTKASMGIKS
eukprot:scaffold1951_cov258-Pinguiococcus_pyrenoidosus.AAC.9